jgi:YbbR domain-containing protein
MNEFLRKYVFQNAGLKIVSLAIAVLLWAAVAHDPVAEMAITAPIEFHHVPDALEISSEQLPQTQIRVRGPARQLRDLAQTEIRAEIDLANARPGEITYEISPRNVPVPRGIQVIQVIPSLLRITFDKRATRQVPVHPRVLGTFASGIHMGKIIVDPDTVTIIGPEKRVNGIDAALTDPVDASGVVDEATFTTHVYVPDPLVRIAKPDPVHVTVMAVKGSGGGAHK